MEKTLQDRCEFVRASFKDTYKRQLNNPAYLGKFMVSTAIGRYGTDPDAKMSLCIRVNVQSVSREMSAENVLNELKRILLKHYHGIPIVLKELEMPQIEQ